ncbi:hypothetical protein KCU70_g394, partial [Aureobasidium melanogenum]
MTDRTFIAVSPVTRNLFPLWFLDSAENVGTKQPWQFVIGWTTPSVAWWRQPPISLVTLQIGACFFLRQPLPSKHSTPLLESYFSSAIMSADKYTVFNHSRSLELHSTART